MESRKIGCEGEEERVHWLLLGGCEREGRVGGEVEEEGTQDQLDRSLRRIRSRRKDSQMPEAVGARGRRAATHQTPKGLGHHRSQFHFSS
jgi:hypothetical protein